MKITAIILTYNEEIHLARCINSILQLTKDIVVIDSYSTDKTLEIAKNFGAKVLQRAWENNHSKQLNWGLSQLPLDTDWVIRIDADETLTPKLIKQIQNASINLDENVNGISFNRKIQYRGQLLRFGGVGSNQVMRLFRFGHGRSESRMMDEHIKVVGKTFHLNCSIIDANLNTISWWIDKHNNYASREAVDLLNLKYQFQAINSIAGADLKSSSISWKRWIKEKIYVRLPTGSRALIYFLYRFIILAGFLDGKIGSQFHFFQAFWYRFLVDIKVDEVEYDIKNKKLTIQESIKKNLGIKV